MRPEKVRDKPAKERIRKGTKGANQAVPSPESRDILPFVNAIVCGDAVTVLSALPGGCVDLIITSPPYNFGHAYAQDPHSDTREWNEYFEKLGAVWTECYRILRPGGRLAVNVQPLFSDYIPTHHILSRQLLDRGFLWKAEILWEKHNYNAKYTAWGSWRSPSMPYLKYTWEFIEVFDKETHKKSGRREDIDITDAEFKEWVIARWSFPPEIRMKHYGHPAMFPEELPRRLMKLFSYRGDIVLDPFNGAGTTTAVARRLGRRFIGIDLSPEYCETALRRLHAADDPADTAAPPPRMFRWEDGGGITADTREDSR
ncbi:MAG: site-specific DNA-methyltransferase [Methanomicrobiales archaeon]|nr:site-specific DNA-methyltransferase [Methanomicrobiales archaeon]MDI6876826.1 site-specific DNA-methyltransferase [Methanomicrobiales archaeon]